MVYRRRPELIIFDLDGTILNSEPASIKCWVEALNDLGYEASAADILPFIGKNLKLIEAEARLRWENLDFKRAHDRKVELNEKINQRGVEIKPGVIRVLDLLDEAGIKTLNALSFKVFLPIYLFQNIYGSDLSAAFRWDLLLFAFGKLRLHFFLRCLDS